MISHRLRRVGSLLLVFALPLGACSDDSTSALEGQPVLQRRAHFREIARTLDQMGLVLRDRKNYDPQEFADNAAELSRIASSPWPLFPAGSNASPSHARPTVWTEPEAFAQAQHVFEDAAQRLLAAALTHHMVEIRIAHDEVVKSCRSCHEKFHRN